jgi:DNA-directed RNA polymerase subunit RPC12/RpoP
MAEHSPGQQERPPPTATASTAAVAATTTVEGGNNKNDIRQANDDMNDQQHTTMDTIRDVRPIKYGSATPPNPTIGSNTKKFRGRGGVWTCENCSEKVQLSSSNTTKQWVCPKCGRTMYTHPKDDSCPMNTFCPCCCWDIILGTK